LFLILKYLLTYFIDIFITIMKLYLLAVWVGLLAVGGFGKPQLMESMAKEVGLFYYIYKVEYKAYPEARDGFVAPGCRGANGGMCNFGEFVQHFVQGRPGRDIAEDPESRTTRPSEDRIERLFNGRRNALFRWDVLLPHANSLRGIQQTKVFEELEKIIKESVREAQKSGKWNNALMNDVDIAESLCGKVLGARARAGAPFLLTQITEEGSRRGIYVKSKPITTGGYTYQGYSHSKSSKSSKTTASEDEKAAFKHWVKNFSNQSHRPGNSNAKFNVGLNHQKIIEKIRKTYSAIKKC
jgi:hypothetical protein